MRIIFLEAVQNFGGSKRSVIDIAHQLTKLGHTILVVDFWGANIEFNKAVKSRGLKMEVLDARSQPIVLGRHNLAARGFSIFKYIFKRQQYKRRFKSVVEKFCPDFVCVNSAKTLDVLSKRDGYSIDYYARGWKVDNGFKERFLLGKYKPRFVAISEATRHAIFLSEKVDLDKVKVLKVAIAEEEFPSPESKVGPDFGLDNPIRLLHAGTFTKNKGQDIAIHVAKALKDKGVHFRLVLAGLVSVSDSSEIYFRYLKELVAELELNDYVQFVVNNHDLRHEMKTMDVFIYPSQTEGLSRVCLEALANGKPVIANPVGGITDYLISGYNGYLVSYNCVGEYVGAIEKYYFSPELCAAHGSKGVEIINSGYLNKAYREALAQIYKY